MWYLLTNDVYLFLLLHQHTMKKINYSSLSKIVGKCRQSLAKYYKELVDDEIISEDSNENIIVNDPFDLTTEELQFIRDHIFKDSSVYIAYHICKNRFPAKSDSEICKLIGVSRTSLCSIKKDVKKYDSTNYVYAIIYNNKIMYVGSTEHLDKRIQQHCQKRPFLTEDNFTILEKCDKVNRFDREAYYRQLFRPEWNINI